MPWVCGTPYPKLAVSCSTRWPWDSKSLTTSGFPQKLDVCARASHLQLLLEGWCRSNSWTHWSPQHSPFHNAVRACQLMVKTTKQALTGKSLFSGKIQANLLSLDNNAAAKGFCPGQWYHSFSVPHGFFGSCIRAKVTGGPTIGHIDNTRWGGVPSLSTPLRAANRGSHVLNTQGVACKSYCRSSPQRATMANCWQWEFGGSMFKARFFVPLPLGALGQATTGYCWSPCLVREGHPSFHRTCHMAWPQMGQ